MKKIYFNIFLILVAAQSFAQGEIYRTLRFGVGLGPAYSDIYGTTGLIITFEPAINCNDILFAGIRFESGGVEWSDSLDDYVFGFTSLALSVQYYFSVEKFRPFIGGGLGSYHVNEDHKTGGIYFRGGFDFGHLSLSADYNMILPSEGSSTPFLTYVGGRIGFFIGGGRKK